LRLTEAVLVGSGGMSVWGSGVVVSGGDG